jgi:transglutaminase-like putative cysteine protease
VAIGQFAQAVRAESDSQVLAVLHALLERLHAKMIYDPDAKQSGSSGPEAFARTSGAAADLTHVFIGAAHSLGIPARFVGGYFWQEDCVEQSGHSWAEAYVPDLGWVGFDVAHGFCPSDAHVRVAVGLDALGAAPVRGTRYGLGGETLEVAIAVGQ